MRPTAALVVGCIAWVGCTSDGSGGTGRLMLALGAAVPDGGFAAADATAVADPVAPAKLDLTATYDSGSSDSDDLTNADSIVVTGRARARSIVHVFGDDTMLAIAVAAADGTFSAALSWNEGPGNGPPYLWTYFAEGEHAFVAREVVSFDDRGRPILGPGSDPLVVTFDRTLNAPSWPVLSPETNSGDTTDDVTNSVALSFAGTCDEDPLEIELFAQRPAADPLPWRLIGSGGSEGGNYLAVGSLATFGSGIGAALRGDYLIFVRFADRAGNIS